MSDNTLHPLLQSLYPSDLQIVPPNVHFDSQGWIIGNNATGSNPYFRTQWIQCSYEISGGCGPTPRYIYYFLALLSVGARHQSWVINAALGSVMVYSSTAAVHALVESLPLTSTGVLDDVPAWDVRDRYRWNRTVADYFVSRNRSAGPAAKTACFYPCFGTSWPLRESAEIYVVESSFGQAIENNLGHAVLLATYVAVAVFTAASVTVACLANVSSVPPDWRPLDIRSAIEHIRTTLISGDADISLWGRLWRLLLRVWVLGNLIVARILSPFVIVGFIGAIEWYMWTVDPGGESFLHVGQWGVLVGALLELLVATVPDLLSGVLHSRFKGLSGTSSV